MTINAPGAALTRKEAQTIVPRAEFRVFGKDVAALVSDKMWAAGAQLVGKRVMKPETYIISKKSDDANVKIRGGLLDIKVRTAKTAEGYEVISPRGKFAFPAQSDDLESVFEALSVEMPEAAGETSFDDFMAMVKASPDLAVVTVEKVRYGFTVKGVICEYAQVWFNGAMVESACCESEDYAAMPEVIALLGLEGRENTNYVRAAKKVIGWL